jgi:hypothetical protein
MGLIPLGILSSAGINLGAYELIETQILGSAASSVTFSGLAAYSATYKHLQIRATLRDAGASASWGFRFNADATNSYARHNLNGNGSTVTAGAGSSEAGGFLGSGAVSGSGANIWTAFVIDLLDPYSTTKNKTVRTLYGNAVPNEIGLVSSLWAKTNSATSFQIYSRFGTNIAANSRLSLYGIR